MITAAQSLARPWSAQTGSVLRGLLPSKHSVCVTWIKTKPTTAPNLCPPCSVSRNCSSPLPASICVSCLETRFSVSKALARLCGRELWSGHTGPRSPLPIFSWFPALLITSGHPSDPPDPSQPVSVLVQQQCFSPAKPILTSCCQAPSTHCLPSPRSSVNLGEGPAASPTSSSTVLQYPLLRRPQTT